MPQKRPKQELGNVCFPPFRAFLLRVPGSYVIETAASTILERSGLPNLAIKRSSKSHVAECAYIQWIFMLLCDLCFFEDSGAQLQSQDCSAKGKEDLDLCGRRRGLGVFNLEHTLEPNTWDSYADVAKPVR